MKTFKKIKKLIKRTIKFLIYGAEFKNKPYCKLPSNLNP